MNFGYLFDKEYFYKGFSYIRKGKNVKDLKIEKSKLMAENFLDSILGLIFFFPSEKF